MFPLSLLVRLEAGTASVVSVKLRQVSEVYDDGQGTELGWLWRWFNERTVQLRALPLVPSPTGPHPARGDSGVCMCIHVCLVWSVFPTSFIVSHHLPVCRQLHTDRLARFDSIWTWRNAHMRTEGSSPTGDRTRAARLAVQCFTNWATPSSRNWTICRLSIYWFVVA